MALTTNNVSYWKLDGNSNDAIGSNNGTDTSITYNSSNGKINQGAGFSSSKIDCGSSSTLRTTTFTFTCWVKPTNFSATMCVNNSGAGGIGYRAWFINATTGTQTMHKEGAAVIGTSSTGLTSGVFNFICVKYDGTNITFYLNGSPDGTNSSAQTFTYGNYTIGARGDGNNPYLGALDEYGYWDRLLSDSEVTQLYNAGAGLQYPYSSSVNAMFAFFFA